MKTDLYIAHNFHANGAKIIALAINYLESLLGKKTACRLTKVNKTVFVNIYNAPTRTTLFNIPATDMFSDFGIVQVASRGKINSPII